ncbi:hypothetical protein C8Q78DRAFT_359239 [Trametes maxima]|nr:hypothetical protein C8Q78DRAFT_359239 [Trametes maxima]
MSDDPTSKERYRVPKDLQHFRQNIPVNAQLWVSPNHASRSIPSASQTQGIPRLDIDSNPENVLEGRFSSPNPYCDTTPQERNPGLSFRPLELLASQTASVTSVEGQNYEAVVASTYDASFPQALDSQQLYPQVASLLRSAAPPSSMQIPCPPSAEAHRQSHLLQPGSVDNTSNTYLPNTSSTPGGGYPENVPPGHWNGRCEPSTGLRDTRHLPMNTPARSGMPPQLRAIRGVFVIDPTYPGPMGPGAPGYFIPDEDVAPVQNWRADMIPHAGRRYSSNTHAHPPSTFSTHRNARSNDTPYQTQDPPIHGSAQPPAPGPLLLPGHPHPSAQIPAAAAPLRGEHFTTSAGTRKRKHRASEDVSADAIVAGSPPDPAWSGYLNCFPSK